MPKSYRLVHLQAICGSAEVFRTASVTLEASDGRRLDGFAEGDGPVDAAYNAINEALLVDAGLSKRAVRLSEFVIKIEGTGTEAKGKAIIAIRADGRELYGTGLSTDIVEASALAYLDALNHLLTERGERRRSRSDKAGVAES